MSTLNGRKSLLKRQTRVDCSTQFCHDSAASLRFQPRLVGGGQLRRNDYEDGGCSVGRFTRRGRMLDERHWYQQVGRSVANKITTRLLSEHRPLKLARRDSEAAVMDTARYQDLHGCRPAKPRRD